MTPLRQALTDYLAMRRALGYQLARAEKLLGQFLAFLEHRGETHVRTDSAVAWATQPTATSPRAWAAMRLSVVRGFAQHLSTIDPATEIPPTDLLPWRARRATPYFYTGDELIALMTAATTLRTSHRVATYQTLIGLLAITGMRVGEAVALDRHDFDLQAGVLIVRHGKFGKARELPLHQALLRRSTSTYTDRTDRTRPRGHPLCWCRRRAPDCLCAMCSGRSARWCSASACSRIPRRAGPDCTTYAIASPSVRSSTRIEKGRTRGRLSRCCPRISVTSTLPTRIGICRPHLTELLQLAGDRLQHRFGGAS